ncbi:hypothetical protein SAMN05444920_107324 [Nonomuraea solani]|uniref:Uncharacterized protein n=1 Tax=Nonomuraea solani TaxID=1144553 RepID=A0A1H6E279_9ACTN|nr:hypothetical protein [Nonomuraea solani]SEG91667.1 hypothetical protein SAMN05444920_107324 [Nonomuraea solani]
MRTRLPAALLLLLSWFLPATAHAQAVQQLTATAQATSWRAEQQHSGMRQVPHPGPVMRAWAGPYGVTGSGAAVLGSGPAGHRHGWAVAVAPATTDAPARTRPDTAPARAPPSTRF